MEPRILLFQDLIFVHCVTFRTKTRWCVSALSNSLSLVVINARWHSLLTVGCTDVGNRLFPNTSIDKDNSVWTLGISTNKRDVYFLNAVSLACSYLTFREVRWLVSYVINRLFCKTLHRSSDYFIRGAICDIIWPLDVVVLRCLHTKTNRLSAVLSCLGCSEQWTSAEQITFITGPSSFYGQCQVTVK